MKFSFALRLSSRLPTSLSIFLVKFSFAVFVWSLRLEIRLKFSFAVAQLLSIFITPKLLPKFAFQTIWLDEQSKSRLARIGF